MAMEKGPLSINSENMFPIIKKWLYSDHDIFYRELISNGCDAITKLKKLDMMGDYELPEGFKPRIDIEVDPQEKTIRVTDNGLGMTADEVKEFINNIAFSGAEAFLEKYKDKASDDQIIGHFGLGFYSSFMVAELVEIDTLSWQAGAKPVHWECDGSSTYAMDDGDRKEVGTTVTLHLSADCVEFSNYYRAQEVIEKYCSFMPVEIYLSEHNTEKTETINESERRPDDVVIEVIEPEKKPAASGEAEGKETEDGEEKPAEKRLRIRRRPALCNNPNPLWAKTPSECTEEEYKEFYRKVFHDYKEPLFWIHLNMDYPFNLKGILYFPKLNLEYESAEGVIKLYNSQVFIADNIKEVIPEFLLLLKGVIDCPDLPLNVSRSALQNDGFAQKISDYISRKVAEKLAGMCRTDKENYDKYWDDISPFIKYGCLRDDKFCEKMTDYILFKDLDGKYHTLPEALEINAKDTSAGETATDENGETVEAEVVSGGDIEENADAKETEGAADTAPEADSEEEKKERTIYYVTDPEHQSQYVRMFRENGMQAFVLEHNIDQPFISQLEAKNEGIHFARIDADVQDALRADTDAESDEAKEQNKADEEKIAKIVKEALDEKDLSVKLETLKDAGISSMLTVDEQTRRMNDMMKMYAMNGLGFGGMGAEGHTLILNAAHPLVKYVLAHEEGENTKLVCEQLYDLALLQNQPLTGDGMAKFVARSNKIMMMLVGEQE
ncbi:MAG: molecular chaperone HtpG [Eubacteriales bacterium]|nr:molecular chaperone HtpG [Eubacteriales bacterium]